MGQFSNKRIINCSGFCFQIKQGELKKLFKNVVCEVTSGAIKVSLLGQIYTWESPEANVEATLKTLATRIEEVGLQTAMKTLDGEWSLIIEDFHLKTTSFVTDHRSTHPIYTVENDHGIFLASSISIITSFTQLELDEDRVAYFLSHGDDGSRKPLFTGSQRHPPGQIVTVKKTGEITIDRWLNWDDTELFRPDINTVKNLIFDSIKIQAKQLTGPVSATLSGGLDSTALCVAVADFSGFKSYSVDIGPDVDNEKEEIDESLKVMGIKHTYTPASFQIENLKDLVFLSGEPIHGFRTISTLFTCAAKASQEGKKSLLYGLGPDTYFFWGTQMQVIQYIHYLVSNLYFPTLLKSIPMLSKYRNQSAISLMGKYILSVLSACKNQGNIVFNKKPKQTVHLKPEYARSLPFKRPINLKALTIQMIASTSLSPSFRASEEFLKIEMASPLFSRKLTQYCLNCESKHMMNTGHTKAIMRKAMEDVLPAHIIWPPVKKKVPFRTNEAILFTGNSPAIVETALASSNILQKMMAKDPVLAFHADKKSEKNADFWLRCTQVAFLEQLGKGE